jgi:type III secretion protein N (ATPase)
VVATRGHLIEAELPFARIGDGVRVCARDQAVNARVAALHGARVVLSPFGGVEGVAAGDRVESDASVLAVALGTPLLGRAIDAAGDPIDGLPAPPGRRRRAGLAARPVGERRPCSGVLWTGVRAIDGPLALGRGARVGVFGPAGAGKSSLLDTVVRGAAADAVVAALIGERGREAERRIAGIDARCTIVCATSDRAPAERVRAAELAFAQADALRARGLDVLLVVDSLARIAAAARELALAAGEPAGRAGYPPAVFALLARLVEVAGPAEEGSVTLVASVLSEGADEHDPVGEAARAMLDGHLVLSAQLAQSGRFPAIDVPRSLSRTLAEVATPEHASAARVLRAATAVLDDSRDARSLGLGSADAFLARCVAHEAALERFLRQGPEPAAVAETLTELRRLADILS